MTLESQVVSLPLAKRLKELGVKQESLFYWSKHKNDVPQVLFDPIFPHSYVTCSAFTVAELGLLLPVMTTSYRGTSKPSGKWCCEYDERTKFYADTEADARTLTLIHLIEQKLITV